MAVLLDDRTRPRPILDPGSEINVMPRRVFEQFEYPIDEDLDNCRINAYDTDPRQAIPGRTCVLHNIPVDIGVVVVGQHIFAV